MAAICFGSGQTTAIAQTLAPVPADDTTAASSRTPAKVETPPSQNAEILKELQEMRARIQQLEAQLKAQSGGGAATPQPATSESASLSISPSSRPPPDPKPAKQP